MLHEVVDEILPLQQKQLYDEVVVVLVYEVAQ